MRIKFHTSHFKREQDTIRSKQNQSSTIWIIPSVQHLRFTPNLLDFKGLALFISVSFTVSAVCSVGSGWLHSTSATVIGSHQADLSSSAGWSIRCSWASPSSIASPNLSLGTLTSPHSARPQPFSMNPSLLGSLLQLRLPASAQWSPGLSWYQCSASLHAPFMSSKKTKQNKQKSCSPWQTLTMTKFCHNFYALAMKKY